MLHARAAVVVFIGLLGAAGCRRDTPAPRPSKEELARLKAEVEKRLGERERARAAKAEPARAQPVPSVEEDDEPPPPAASIAPPQAPKDAPFIADAPVELTSPAQATATANGVVFNTREGEILVARLGAIPRGPLAARTPLTSLPATAGPFSLGRGPTVGADAVYWISHGSLARRALPPHGAPGPLEVLARDAFDGTRVAIPVAAPGKTLPPLVPTAAYIVRPEKDDAPLLAKLWVEGQQGAILTAEGNSTHSVALVRTEDGVLALSVQARMAMTPVHARRIPFDGKRPLVGEDTVVWVGGGIQPLTEMTILPSGDKGLFGFIPHERSMREFGIARLDIGTSPTMETPTTWLLYPNGIDPAPVAAAHLCGEPVLLYAAPESPAPGSAQELLVRSLADPSGKRVQRLATGRAFYFVSIAEVRGGALAVWVTDSATWACTVRCQARAR